MAVDSLQYNPDLIRDKVILASIVDILAALVPNCDHASMIKLAQKQAAHQRKQESLSLGNQFAESRLRLVLGFLIACLAITGGCVVLLFGSQWIIQLAGGFLGAGGVAELVKIIVHKN